MATSAIGLARNIAQLRRRKGVTQDGLASYLGVTKASVSKWETGQSFPDILLLPQLATYFGVTLDQLMGYEPQLGKEAIRDWYTRLSSAFATEPFEKVVAECHALVHDYCSCCALLAQMAVLYLNHHDRAPTPEQGLDLLNEAVDLCERVRQESASVSEVKQATAVQATACMMLGRPAEVVDLLQADQAPQMGEDVLLVSAYLALGETDKAAVANQASVYQGLLTLLNELPQMARLVSGDPERLREVHRRTLALIDAFDLDRLYLNSAAVHLLFAQLFAAAGSVEESLDCLERYARCCALLEFPLKMRGDSFFDRLDTWLGNLDLGSAAPRDDALVKQSMVASVAENPAFAQLAGNGRFQTIVENIREVAR